MNFEGFEFQGLLMLSTYTSKEMYCALFVTAHIGLQPQQFDQEEQ